VKNNPVNDKEDAMPSTGHNFILDTAMYKEIRATQTKKAAQVQFQRLAGIANGVEPKIDRHRFGGQPLPPPLPHATKTAFAPYTSGNPNPEYRFNSTTGQVQESGPGISEFALGNPKLGRISLGAYGGISLWGVFTPLRGEWLLGDATVVSASLLEIFEIDNGTWPLNAPSLECVVYLSNSALLAQLGQTGSLICTAGKASSAIGGFVGASGMLEVTARLFSEDSQLVATESSSEVFLELAVNAQKPGTGDGPLDPAAFLACEWLFDSSPDRTILGSVNLPLHTPPNRPVIQKPMVVVEATVQIACGRGGIGDPGGGFFAFDFADTDDHADSLYFSSANAFFGVPRITLTAGFWEQ
jgi:hypothetical protein